MYIYDFLFEQTLGRKILYTHFCLGENYYLPSTYLHLHFNVNLNLKLQQYNETFYEHEFLSISMHLRIIRFFLSPLKLLREIQAKKHIFELKKTFIPV